MSKADEEYTFPSGEEIPLPPSTPVASLVATVTIRAAEMLILAGMIGTTTGDRQRYLVDDLCIHANVIARLAQSTLEAMR